MTDIARDIGGLEARMDEHDKRLDELKEMVTVGFRETKAAIDELRGAESRRKGAASVVKFLLGAGGMAAIWEIAKGVFRK